MGVRDNAETARTMVLGHARVMRFQVVDSVAKGTPGGKTGWLGGPAQRTWVVDDTLTAESSKNMGSLKVMPPGR